MYAGIMDDAMVLWIKLFFVGISFSLSNWRTQILESRTKLLLRTHSVYYEKSEDSIYLSYLPLDIVLICEHV